VATLYHKVEIINIWAASRLKQAVREATTICPRPFDLKSDIPVTCDVGYLYANVSLPRRLCSLLRPDVRDRVHSRLQ